MKILHYRRAWTVEDACPYKVTFSSARLDKAMDIPNLANQLRNEAQTFPFSFIIPATKVLEGVGNFFQEVSDNIPSFQEVSDNNPSSNNFEKIPNIHWHFGVIWYNEGKEESGERCREPM